MWLRIAAVITAALVTDAANADAQQWYQLCTGGSTSSCAALQVGFTSMGATTHIAVRAQNLQGGFPGSTGPSVLDQLFLHFLGSVSTASGVTDAPVAGPGVTAYSGTGNLAGTSPGAWSFDANGSTLALFADNPALGHFTDIRGCDGPSPLEDPGYITCGAAGTRWVELGLDVQGSYTDADLQSVGFATSYGALGLDQHICNDTPNPQIACQVTRFTPDTTVPEPSTVALVGAGVAVLAFAGHHRRTLRV